MEKRLLIVGSTSGIGKHCMEQALFRGMQVRAFARTADTLQPHASLDRMVGDATKPEDVERALKGVDAVIVTLGIRERLAMLWERETLFSKSTEVLLSQMVQAGVSRLVVVTGYGAGRSQRSMMRLARVGHGLVLGRVYEDKTRQEALIETSDLAWTIARPVILTNRPAAGAARVLEDPATWRNGFVSREAVASYLLDAVEHDLNVQMDVVLSS
ncbi:MAG: SDR family oxidoreductase [Rhodobacteraceae bacterium]|nr:SDR family oxidoreductase [Paracoccaceae bacterium]